MDKRTPAFSELPLFWKTLIAVGLVTVLILVIVLVSVGSFMLTRDPDADAADPAVNIDEYSALIGSFGAPDPAEAPDPVGGPDPAESQAPEDPKGPNEPSGPKAPRVQILVPKDLRGNPLRDLLAVRIN